VGERNKDCKNKVEEKDILKINRKGKRPLGRPRHRLGDS